jgi:hypothetical protein
VKSVNLSCFVVLFSIEPFISFWHKISSVQKSIFKDQMDPIESRLDRLSGILVACVFVAGSTCVCVGVDPAFWERGVQFSEKLGKILFSVSWTGYS